MKRNLLVGGMVIALVVAVILAKCGGGGSGTKTSQSAGSAGATSTTNSTQRDKPIDPRKLQRASISGTVTNLETRAPIVGARVCGDGTDHGLSPQHMREPLCAITDASGVYTLQDLVPATYGVTATAKTYRPTAYRMLDDDGAATNVHLKPGEAKAGIDIALRPGGVQVTGIVSDVTGGPIAQAQVRATSTWSDLSPPEQTDADGKFTIWTNPGRVQVVASAEGYVSASDWGRAPGTFELALTPESSLSGTVVDAITNQPVSGVRVYLRAQDTNWDGSDDPSDITDEQGTFRIAKLSPGRYSALATAAHGFARANGSTLVGLGQHVDGVVVRLHAGAHLSGKIVKPDKTPCTDGYWSLRDRVNDRYGMTRMEPDGALHADGVLPGSYEVEIRCRGFIAREKYEPILVTQQDIDNLVFEVDAGATVRGRLVTKRGEPVPDANLNARSSGGAARADTQWSNARTNVDGTFTLAGLAAGTYKLQSQTDRGASPPDTGWPLEIAAGAMIERDFVLEEGGKLLGSVVDSNGKPIPGVRVRAFLASGIGGRADSATTGQDGSFAFESLTPGDYQVAGYRSTGSALRKAGTTDDAKQHERVTILANKTATVKLVYEALDGWIKGTVVDASGAPASDAYITVAREPDGEGQQQSVLNRTRWGDRKPTITATDGTFTVADLTPGKYAIRAYIRGGGEAVAEHVPVGTTTKLQLRPTGSITGTVTTAKGPVEEIEVELRDPRTGLRREETYFRSEGAFALNDLPAGAYTLTASAANGKKQIEVALADGEHKTVSLTLEGFITITGRVVDAASKPVPGISMSASAVKDGSSYSTRSSKENLNVTGDDGRFTLENQPTGSLVLRGWPKDWQTSEYQGVSAIKEVVGTGSFDVGDLVAMKRRVKQGEKPGELGIRWVADPPGTPQDKRVFKVRHIDPSGPAAKTSLKVGDVVVSVDGTDITGANAVNGAYLMTGLPGTKLTLGLQGGSSVTITLAAPN